MPRSAEAGTSDPIRSRLLEATSVVVSQVGPRKLSLTEIAAVAGVSRPTVYRYFGSKDELLQALAAHEKDRFASELAAAIHDVDEAEKLDRSLRFVVEFQQEYPMRGLMIIEPAFMLDQLERSLKSMAGALVPFLDELAPAVHDGRIEADDLADLVVRTALSNFVVHGEDAQLLRELRHVVGLIG